MHVQRPLRNVLCLLALAILAPWEGRGRVSQAQQCVGIDGCTCTFDDGSGVIDISSLGNTDGTARFLDVQASDGYHYSYNPCYGFSEISCSNAAVCQVSADKLSSYQAGDATSATWSYDGQDVQLFYDSFTDTLRESRVTFRCSESASQPSISVIGETEPAIYEMTVTSKCACKNGCSGGGSITVEVEVELSAGGIMLIIFFVLLFVYLVAGMVFNRTQRQARGIEMVPNLTFWKALPGLIKDGFVFTINVFRGKKSGYDQV